MSAATFVMTPMSLLERRHLSPLARIVWVRLKSHYRRTDGQCNPRHATLAKELEVSVSSIERAGRELRLAGLISATNKHGRGNFYTFHESGSFQQAVEAVKNAENVEVCPVTGDGSAPSPVQGLPRHPCRVGGSVSIYEPDVLNQRGATGAADKASALVERCEKRAAAATRPDSQIILNLEPGDPVREQAEALVDELHAIHPQPGLPAKAIDEVQRILAAAEDVDATVERIRTNHASWKAHWETFRPGQFIPQLWRWFRDGEWKRTVGKPVKSETWYQRVDRKTREYQAGEHILQPLFDAEMEEWRAKQRRFAGG